jgi:fucose 4-O-acetylase-like acetyltransferase
MENGNRIDWIDYGKFVAIYAVVLGHVGPSHFIDNFIHLWHVPMFFFLSGLCYNSEKYRRNFSSFILSRIKTILFPYFVFAIILYVTGSIIFFVLDRTEEITSITLFLKALLYCNYKITPYRSIQWFLTALFFTELLFWTIKRLTNSRWWTLGICIFSSIVGLLFYYYSSFRLPLGIDIAFIGAFFFGIAHESKSFFLNDKVLFHAKYNWILIVGLFIVLIISHYTTLNMMEGYYPYFLLSILIALFSIFNIVFLVKNISTTINIHILTNIQKTILYLGRNTLLILVLNGFVIDILKGLGIIKKIMSFANFQGSVELIQCIMTVVVILIIWPVIVFINKYTPFLVGKFK